MNADIYHQIAKTTVADRLRAAELARTARAVRGQRADVKSARPRTAVLTRRIRVLARLRTA